MKRFWDKVDKSGDCWVWKASVNNRGYGQYRHGDTMRLAHRVAYMTEVGPIPDDSCILHTCDNRRCVNPSHLFVGSNSDNTNDMLVKERNVCKLSFEEAELIRNDYAFGQMTQREIAEEFGVSTSNIKQIIAGTIWKREVFLPA